MSLPPGSSGLVMQGGIGKNLQQLMKVISVSRCLVVVMAAIVTYNLGISGHLTTEFIVIWG